MITQALEVQAKRPGGYAFGMDRDAVAAKLHELADAVKSGQLLPQALVIAASVKVDDFEIETVILKYAIKNLPVVLPIKEG